MASRACACSSSSSVDKGAAQPFKRADDDDHHHHHDDDLDDDVDLDEGMEEDDSWGAEEREARADPRLFTFRAEVRIPFVDAEAARRVKRSMDVDKEISPDKIRRRLEVVMGGAATSSAAAVAAAAVSSLAPATSSTATSSAEAATLVMVLEATEARLLRASLASSLDMMAVTLRVLCEFDDAAALDSLA